MEKYISKNVKDLFTEESLKHLDDSMISDINYVMQNTNARRVTLDYGSKMLDIEKTMSGGVALRLNVDGKDIEVVSK